MRWFRTFIGGILAGISIAIGGTVFLSLENKVLGALFFTVGLFAVCTFGFNLYTGKVCYVFDQDRKYALGLPLIWLGNLAGTLLTALAERATRVGPALAEKAQAICTVKLNDGESLASYAHRRLKELQAVSKEISYSRSYNPDVLITDRIRLHYPAQDLSGIFVVVSQSVTLDACATTTEEVRAA